MKNIAIIPARGGSKRIPLKNIRDFHGYPVIRYSIKAAQDCGCFERIIVSTDNQKIASIARFYGAETPFLRSKENSSDKATTADALREVLSKLQSSGYVPDNFCCIYPVAPMIKPEYIKKAYGILISKKTVYSIISATRYPHPIERAFKVKYGGNISVCPKYLNKRTQDLAVHYYDSGQFYWLRTNSFLNESKVFSSKSAALILPQPLTHDVDSEEDWKMAEAKYEIISKSKNLAVCYLGGTHVGALGLLCLLSNKCNIRGVVAYSDEVKEITRRFNIPCVSTLENKNFNDFVKKSDLILSVHGRELVKQAYLDKAIFGGVNIHPYLYMYKGRDPVKRALRDKNYSASVGAHYMTKKVDSGKVISEIFVNINGASSEKEAYNMLYPCYIKVIFKVIERFMNEKAEKSFYNSRGFC